VFGILGASELRVSDDKEASPDDSAYEPGQIQTPCCRPREVFTPAWLVEAMLDLVKEETERIDSRFLEPACGSGNFVVQILRRKLAQGDALGSQTCNIFPTLKGVVHCCIPGRQTS
jgi:hypothetical protein